MSNRYQLFANAPMAAKAFDTLARELEALGPLRLEEKKTCLHVCAGKGAFLGIHPRKTGLRLTIATSDPIRSPRIVKCEQASKNRFHNDFDFAADAEVDADLRTWLKLGYERVSAVPQA